MIQQWWGNVFNWLVIPMHGHAKIFIWAHVYISWCDIWFKHCRLQTRFINESGCGKCFLINGYTLFILTSLNKQLGHPWLHIHEGYWLFFLYDVGFFIELNGRLLKKYRFLYVINFLKQLATVLHNSHQLADDNFCFT